MKYYANLVVNMGYMSHQSSVMVEFRVYDLETKNEHFIFQGADGEKGERGEPVRNNENNF